MGRLVGVGPRPPTFVCGLHGAYSTQRGGRFRDHRVIRDYQGSITNRRLKRVCRTCNNGWMSNEEMVARYAVTLIITGQPQHLTRELRYALRRWITMKLMVLDTMRDGEQAFTEPERREFYARPDIPDALSIWLLRCGEAGWGSLFWSHAQSLTAVPENTLAEAMPPLQGLPNRKMFLWGVGGALVAAVYQRNIGISLNMPPEYSIQLSPDLGVARLWPPKPINSRSLTLSLTTLPEVWRAGDRT